MSEDLEGDIPRSPAWKLRGSQVVHFHNRCHFASQDGTRTKEVSELDEEEKLCERCVELHEVGVPER